MCARLAWFWQAQSDCPQAEGQLDDEAASTARSRAAQDGAQPCPVGPGGGQSASWGEAPCKRDRQQTAARVKLVTVQKCKEATRQREGKHAQASKGEEHREN